MAEYMVRVELLKAGWDDYDDLHEGMEALGLKRTVIFEDGSVRKLPIGTYFGVSNLEINDIRDRVRVIATPLSATSGPYIFVSQSQLWSAFLPKA